MTDGLDFPDPGHAGFSDAALARLDRWADEVVRSGQAPGLSVRIERLGMLAYRRHAGLADLARAVPVAEDTIFRVYSMTKPVTSVAAMMLYEEGRFQLDDPVSRFLPCFAAPMQVAVADGAGGIDLRPAARPITIRDLLTHTAGFTHARMEQTLMAPRYLEEGIEFETAETSLPDLIDRAVRLPLIAQPGAEFNYSIATDILGYLLEVIAGQPFERLLQERIFGPLGLHDTGFHVPDGKAGRFAANYLRGRSGRLTLIDDPGQSRFRQPPRVCSGGAGLVSTIGDFQRFCRMLLNKGALDGTRLLGRKTVELMTANHLDREMSDGIGFGLGFSITLDPVRVQLPGSPGDCGWGGAASTLFWIDPAEQLSVILMTQSAPFSNRMRRDLRVGVYAALS